MKRQPTPAPPPSPVDKYLVTFTHRKRIKVVKKVTTTRIIGKATLQPGKKRRGALSKARAFVRPLLRVAGRPASCRISCTTFTAHSCSPQVGFCGISRLMLPALQFNSRMWDTEPTMKAACNALSIDVWNEVVMVWTSNALQPSNKTKELESMLYEI